MCKEIAYWSWLAGLSSWRKAVVKISLVFLELNDCPCDVALLLLFVLLLLFILPWLLFPDWNLCTVAALPCHTHKPT